MIYTHVLNRSGGRGIRSPADALWATRAPRSEVVRFEWDPRKATSNARKHGVTFAEASTAFGDPLSVTIRDPDRALDEERFVLVGQSARGRLLVVVHAERDDKVRVISARTAVPAERRAYEDS
jgi:uncharacterized protein